MSHFDRIEGTLNEDHTITNVEENQEAQNMKEENIGMKKAAIIDHIDDKSLKM